MTIIGQLRWAALYARDPWEALPFETFRVAMDFERQGIFWRLSWGNIQGRTFLLLVAEALE